MFLDEPTTGLDLKTQDRVLAFLKAFVMEGGALVMTSHNWEEIEALCGALTLIDSRDIVLSGKLREIHARGQPNVVLNRSFRLACGVELS